MVIRRALVSGLVSSVLLASSAVADDGLAVVHGVPSAESLRRLHDEFASEPHPAGSAGDRRMIGRMIAHFAAMGLTVERHDFDAYLAQPVAAALEIVSPVQRALPLQERPLPEDPDTGHPALGAGYNAYSGTGDVTGEVVYANYGRKEDFAALRERGVDLRGKIVIARYGRNYRGFKAQFAEEAGAAGLVMYTDPEESGYARGLMYPEGGYANDTSIQRGSVKTLPYAGDPLTPFEEASEDAARLDPETLALPRIPVQPVGWAAAAEILSRMKSSALPGELVAEWQGGLPFAYRLEGGPALRVRLAVRQRRGIVRSSNVLGRLTGTTYPDEYVVVGCHHDAWGFGASDPTAGLIVLFEAARSLGEAARRGHRPARTVVFAAWGAEEHGIVGSTEWCEANRDGLAAGGVAYVNLDMAAMGMRFRSASAPLLKSVIEDAAQRVEGANGATIHQAWTAGGDAAFGNLGGGSDHIAFYCHLGIPSCSLGAGGARGTAYHSNYDTLTWYRRVVGDDYASAEMVTRMANDVVWSLANAPLLPLDPRRVPDDLLRHLDGIERRGTAVGMPVDLGDLRARAEAHRAAIGSTWERLSAAVAAGRLEGASLAAANAILRRHERAWLDPDGLPDRPWFRNLFAASDPDSGYAAWMLPGLRAAVEARDEAMMAEWRARYGAAIDRLAADEAALRRLLDT